MSDPNIVVNGGFDLPLDARRVDRWRVRCDRCGGPVDGFHREVAGEHPDLGWTQRVYCRACVAAVPDVGLVER
jgi:hypothetical protein